MHYSFLPYPVHLGVCIRLAQDSNYCMANRSPPPAIHLILFYHFHTKPYKMPPMILYFIIEGISLNSYFQKRFTHSSKIYPSFGKESLSSAFKI